MELNKALNTIFAAGPRIGRRWATSPKIKRGIPAKRHGGAWGVTLSKEELKALLSKVDLEQH